MPLDGQPPGQVPIVPDRRNVDGLRVRSSVPLRCIFPSAMECMSPLMTSGARPFMADIAAIKRSCCFSQPGCQ
jgi:hypothetical protein